MVELGGASLPRRCANFCRDGLTMFPARERFLLNFPPGDRTSRGRKKQRL